MSHIIGVRKKVDSQKGVRKAAASQKRGPQSKKFGNLWSNTLAESELKSLNHSVRGHFNIK